MTSRRLGRQTVALLRPPSVVSYANIGGKFEANGPLAGHFDLLCTDSFFGKDTWEQAESAMQQEALTRALEKGGLTPAELDYVLAGDLLNQCIGTAFGLRDFQIPFFGLYGACSTMGEGLALASMTLDGGFGEPAALRRPRPDGGLHDQLPLLHRRAAVPHAGALRQPADPHRPVDCYRRRVLYPGGPGGRAVYHPCDLRENRGHGHHRREQHGGRHGPRRL